MRHLLAAILSLLFLAACSTTEGIPEGEQLYLGIKSIGFDDGRHAAKGRGGKTETAESGEGVITSIADAYSSVQALIEGRNTDTDTPDTDAEAKARSREERRAQAAFRQTEATALATAREEVSAALAYEPNASLFGSSSLTSPWKLGLWTYNRYVNSTSAFGKWVFRKFADQPVLISTVAPQTRAKVAQGTLRNYGYFRGVVNYSVIESRDPRAARISYDVKTGPLFRLDSIEYRSFGPAIDSILTQTDQRTLLNRTLTADGSESLLHSGDAFSVVTLSDEQTRIDRLLRDRGYYFWTPRYTTYQADTVAVPGAVQLRVMPAAGIPDEALRPWTIGHTYVTLRDGKGSPLDHERSTRRGATTYYWSGETMPAKSRLWRTAISHRHGRPYSITDQETTITKLSQLGFLSSVEVNYTARDTTSTCDTLDVFVAATMGKLYDSSFEVGGTLKSSQQLGPALRYELAKRNAFGGGEKAAWDIYGSYEWQLGRRSSAGGGILNSFELGSSMKIELPRFAFPFIARRHLRFPATTSFALKADWKNRSGFFQMIDFGAHVDYNWTRGRYRHTWELLALDYYYLSHVTERFNEISSQNPAIYAAMRTYFVPTMGYSLTYASPADDRRPIWLQATIKEGGNLTDGLHRLFVHNLEPDAQRRIFGSRYAQFIKATAEAHYSFPLSENLSLATRAFAGIIYTYASGDTAPYAEQFYIGGANSIRAFTVRTAGPGAYRTRDTKFAYIDQTGDFKLEANAELRARIVGGLHGAVFLDAGNIWLLRNDPSRPGGALSAKTIDNIALGTGLGIRYDLDFLVLRFDVGIGLHAPYATSRSGFYNFERFGDSVAYHFAIGYPF